MCSRVKHSTCSYSVDDKLNQNVFATKYAIVVHKYKHIHVYCVISQLFVISRYCIDEVSID